MFAKIRTFWTLWKLRNVVLKNHSCYRRFFMHKTTWVEHYKSVLGLNKATRSWNGTTGNCPTGKCFLKRRWRSLKAFKGLSFSGGPGPACAADVGDQAALCPEPVEVRHAQVPGRGGGRRGVQPCTGQGTGERQGLEGRQPELGDAATAAAAAAGRRPLEERGFFRVG